MITMTEHQRRSKTITNMTDNQGRPNSINEKTLHTVTEHGEHIKGHQRQRNIKIEQIRNNQRS